MKGPSITDWGFEEIRASDPDREARLEAAASPDSLIAALAAAVEQANCSGDIRIGLDSRDNQFIDCRAIIQFRVDPDLYDWFFNARTGYRAQFWISPDNGIEFNGKITKELADFLSRRLPQQVTTRRIATTYDGQSREDKDLGAATVHREHIVRSLEPRASKIWICERLIQHDSGTIKDIGFVLLSEAALYLPKLCIPRWASAEHPKTKERGEGLRAPYPCPDYAWLDLKGGFVGRDGTVIQVKPQDERAMQLYQRGWT